MNAQDIIELAIEYRTYYNTRDARIVANKLGIEINYSNMNPDVFKAHIVQFSNYKPIISINSNFSDVSQRVLCAHELGHFLLHDTSINHFATASDLENMRMEYEANLFAVAFLFNESEFNRPLESLNNYLLKQVLDYNIWLKE